MQKDMMNFMMCAPGHALQVHAVRILGKHRATALDKHRRHVVLLARARRNQKQQQELQQQHQAEQQARFADFNQQLRTAILNNDNVADIWEPARKAGTLRTQQQETQQTLKHIKAQLQDSPDTFSWIRAESHSNDDAAAGEG